AMTTATISIGVKCRSNGWPSSRLMKTSTGATNRAIWMPLPTAMVTARSILFLAATSTAVECSAAFPTVATTMTPTNTSLMPTAPPPPHGGPDQPPPHRPPPRRRRQQHQPGGAPPPPRLPVLARRGQLLLRAGEQVLVGAQAEHQAQHVHRGEDDGDLLAQ